jgi:hypothetical protein
MAMSVQTGREKKREVAKNNIGVGLAANEPQDKDSLAGPHELHMKTLRLNLIQTCGRRAPNEAL